MPTIHSITAKFIKIDRFENIVFLVSDKDDLSSGYRKAKAYYKTIDKGYDTSNPIYLDSKDYATLRFKRSNKLRDLENGTTYNIKFSFVENTWKEQAHCNLICLNIN